MNEHIRMHVPANHEFEATDGPGSFVITEHGLQGRPSVDAHMCFVCPNGKNCAVFLSRKGFEERRSEDEPNVWGWDGNANSPSLSPSINCITHKDGKPVGGCGAHFNVTNGEFLS